MQFVRYSDTALSGRNMYACSPGEAYLHMRAWCKSTTNARSEAEKFTETSRMLSKFFFIIRLEVLKT